MDFNELILKRESCRAYDPRPVEKEKLAAVMEAARLAPSACNSQPWRYVVINGKETVAEIPPLLKRGAINGFTDDVPCFIVVCETKAKLMPGVSLDSQTYAQMDIGLSVAHTILAASAQGLSTCVMGCFDEGRLKELLSIPEDVKIRLVVALGYAKDGQVRTKIRKDFEEICSFNRW